MECNSEVYLKPCQISKYTKMERFPKIGSNFYLLTVLTNPLP